MEDINNWDTLIKLITEKTNNSVFSKLLTKVQQTLRIYQKSDVSFDGSIVREDQCDVFNNYKLLYLELLIEEDAIDINHDILSLTSKNKINFNIIGVGKWIKLHNGNTSRIFFFDSEKTILSDKSLADFLNKVVDIKSKYKYFNHEPQIYYKFRILPCQDIIDHMLKFGVIAIEFGQKTPKNNYFQENKLNKVLLDQSMIYTLCSNLSHGFSTSFYEYAHNKSKEIMIQNLSKIEEYLADKIILIDESTYKQTRENFLNLAGPNEMERFDELCKKSTIVPDEINARFYYLKNNELINVSVAEREIAIYVTGNSRSCNKINCYYKEIPYKLFVSAQLAETKYL